MLKRTTLALTSAVSVAAAALAFATPNAVSQAPGSCEINGAVINGNNNDNTLVGTPRNDVINGNGGDDRIDGRGGRDVIRGGAGHDRIRGGGCNDVMGGGPGNDRIDGEAGANDNGSGGPGADFCSAATENQVSC